MRRLAVPSLFLLLISGCSQVFDSNLFSSIDPAPTLDANALKSKSATDLEAMIENDSSFFESLKANNTALQNVHNVLYSVYTALSGGDSASTKASVIRAAQDDILAMTFGSGLSGVVKNAFKQVGNLSDVNTAGAAVTALFASQSKSDVTLELSILVSVQNAFDAMQIEAASGSSIDESTYWGTTNKGNLAQVSLVMADIFAVLCTYGLYSPYTTPYQPDETTLDADIAQMTNQIVSGVPLTPSTSAQSMTDLKDALGASQNPSTNIFAYVYVGKKLIP